MSGRPVPLPEVPFNDLRRNASLLRDSLAVALTRVADSGWYALGNEVSAFEQAFARYVGSAHAVGVANGTDALEIALRAVGVGAGQEVLTAANAGMYATVAILACGAMPRFVDVAPDTLCLSADRVKEQLTKRCAAVIVTHLYGRMADMKPLNALAADANVPLIEDCAQAHGAVLAGRGAGTWGAVGCYSFYPTKNLGALGDGGAVVTSDAALADRIRKLRQYGWGAKYHADLPGGRNSRLDEIQAAVLSVKLPHLDQWNACRRRIAAIYFEATPEEMSLAQVSEPESHVNHLYAIRSRRREKHLAQLRRARIATEVHYPVPDYRQPSIRSSLDAVVPLAETERACNEVISVPCFPEMTESEIDRVANALSELTPG
ncbi:MAG TPA: DegT/DnrJ/EryC1/StrS family aminotransferase [Nitrospira sp.]|nr:DegT/DnrJ/EryC1/StrS family aminotransferase [Nitrospira sp.]